MRATVRLFWILTAFCILVAVVYFVWNGFFDAKPIAQDPNGGEQSGLHIEWVGTISLLLVGLLSALIAFYVGRVYKGQGGELPEDRQDANIDDGEAEQGFFSPWSWWPVMLAGSAALMFLGIAVGVWICFIAVALAAVSLVGFTFEYNRGNFGH